MKVNWVGLIIMALLCIAMDVFISRRLKRRGYRWAMWFNVLLALLSAGLVISIGLLPMSRAATSNSTFVTCQYIITFKIYLFNLSNSSIALLITSSIS